MKRCPECDFLYENESTLCDMDGTPLRYTVKLPMLPGLAQSIWDRWTIALLCAVVLGTVLVILYRATPPAFTSPSPGQMKSELPAANQSPQLPESAPAAESSASPQEVDESSDSRDPFEPRSATSETKSQRLQRSSPVADQKESSPAPVIHFEPPASPRTVSSSNAAGNAVVTAAPASETSASQTSMSSANSASIHARPPDSTTNKVKTQDQKKDSGIKSFFKKAGQVLKKPFGEN